MILVDIIKIIGNVQINSGVGSVGRASASQAEYRELDSLSRSIYLNIEF